MAEPPDEVSPLFTPARRTRFRARLLKWFARDARPLPWRQSRDAYAIWVSEVMLQQTQVATVIPFFERFLKAFPTVSQLAQAQEQEVLRLWEGLGFYHRARNLHRAARILMSEHQGEWPQDRDLAARLPGLGRYSVNAILSQAFDQRLPVLEANTRRVLCRLSGERADLGQKAVEERLWNRAGELLPRRGAGDFNQALMELGALLCTPEKPACERCPVQSFCQARALNLQEAIPFRRPPPTITQVRELALVLRAEDRFFLVQRPAQGRWANLWEFPHLEWNEPDLLEAAGNRLLEQLGFQADLAGELAILRHTVTRFRVALHAYLAIHRGGSFRPGLYVDGRWVLPAELGQYPLSSPQRRLAGILNQPRQAQLF